MIFSLTIVVSLTTYIPSSSSSLPDTTEIMINSTKAASETDLLNNPNITECIENQLCNHGQCINIGSMKTSCKCFKPFVDHEGQPCKEEGKSKLVAFLLSFFVGGFGADWFYLSRGDAGFVIIGILKCLITGVLPFLIFCCWMCCFATVFLFKDDAKDDDDETVCTCCACVGIVCATPLIILLIITGSIWWLVDWIRIIAGSWEKDGMGLFLFIDM